MFLQEQVGTLPRFERLRQSRVENLPRSLVIGCVILAWLAYEDSYERIDESRRDRGNRRQTRKQKNLFCAGLSDAGKFLGHFLGGFETSFRLVFGFKYPLLHCRP